MPPADHSVSGISFRGKPAAIGVAVLQGSRALGSGHFTPSYTMTQPNGPDCEPTCLVAPGAQLTLAP